MSDCIAPNTAWLTVNRFCNFRCKWCYAEDTHYSRKDNLPLALARKIIHLFSEVGIQEVRIIGGEPTFWPYLKQALELIASLGMQSTIITNGFLFSREKFMTKMSKLPIRGVAFSLKAGGRSQYLDLVGVDAYDDIVRAIRNLSQSQISFGINMTLNHLVRHDLVEMIKMAVDNGAESVSIDFCATVFKEGEPEQGFMMNPREVVDSFVEAYDQLNQITKGNLQIGQSLPYCIWSDGFLDELIKRDQANFGCQLTSHTGLLFDTQGNIIPCNCMTDVKIGKMGVDFHDADTFRSFWGDRQITSFFDQIISYPSQKCVGCEKFDLCGGGCPLQWFVFDPREVIG